MGRKTIIGIASIAVVLMLAGPAAPAPRKTQPSAEAWVRQHLLDEDRKHPDWRDPDLRYLVAEVRLSPGPVHQAVAYISSPSTCGTGGCNLLVLTQTANSWRILSSLTVVHLPVRVLNTQSHGWKDLGVWVSGGGAKSHEARLSYDAHGRYPSNPTAPPARPVTGAAGKTVLSYSMKLKPLYSDRKESFAP